MEENVLCNFQNEPCLCIRRLFKRRFPLEISLLMTERFRRYRPRGEGCARLTRKGETSSSSLSFSLLGNSRGCHWFLASGILNRKLCTDIWFLFIVNGDIFRAIFIVREI